mgnify:CR=1 FL=1
MKILIVDDEELIRNVIKTYCVNEGYQTFEAENGIKAIDVLTNNENIDLIILDIMMPKMDGFETLKKIREIKDIPVIMLSARKEEIDKLSSFNLGVDDYVTKPFSPKELMARIKAVLKRSEKLVEKYTYKTLELDTLGHTLKIDNKIIKITPKEYELLIYFIENKGVALTREQLLTKVWGYDFYGDDRTVDTHIKMLRHNLGKYRNLIQTVRSVGYKYDNETE